MLVSGALDDGGENLALGQHLADTFAVVVYRRRGRGDSGDNQPYALAREIEDLAAILDAAGGRAHVFGASSGGALALEAAAAGLPINSIAAHEVPYLLGEPMVTAWRTYTESLTAALDADDRDEALRLSMRLAGSPDEQIVLAQGLDTPPAYPTYPLAAPPPVAPPARRRRKSP